MLYPPVWIKLELPLGSSVVFCHVLNPTWIQGLHCTLPRVTTPNGSPVLSEYLGSSFVSIWDNTGVLSLCCTVGLSLFVECDWQHSSTIFLWTLFFHQTALKSVKTVCTFYQDQDVSSLRKTWRGCLFRFFHYDWTIEYNDYVSHFCPLPSEVQRMCWNAAIGGGRTCMFVHRVRWQ